MNPLLDSAVPCLLALEDGTTYLGRCCGTSGEAFGEMVFNTSMTGYLEIITDPSYAGQVVVLTYPQVGNYGVCRAQLQGDHPALAALVVHDLCRTPSHWTSEMALDTYLAQEGVVAMEGVDTRALVRHIREKGTMACGLSTEDLDPASLVERVRAQPPISAHNHVADVSRTAPVDFPATGGDGPHPLIVAVDCGEKTGILQRLTAEGMDVRVVPWDTPAETILAMEPDGVFFSNGPGDPRTVGEPATCAAALLGRVPLFGICLGHQMLSQAAGATIEKLPYGHHGGNQPVCNLLTSMVEVTAQNHNYGLVFQSLGPLVPELSGGLTEHPDDLRTWVERGVAPVVETPEAGRVQLTHVALNDGTPEGIRFLDRRAFSVQYHPEACPGPHDSSYLFRAFRRLVTGDPEYLTLDRRDGRRA